VKDAVALIELRPGTVLLHDGPVGLDVADIEELVERKPVRSPSLLVGRDVVELAKLPSEGYVRGVGEAGLAEHEHSVLLGRGEDECQRRLRYFFLCFAHFAHAVFYLGEDIVGDWF
jgi:hypothetical protein